ncbi:hypothetical protein PILCRDRAFT_682449 [Piloderma croceum F 1598]|uniref:Uncharacterized protein n=1 Tax=Piloderma croceum (strain F 1598) TaxID=765440 RepID=A0A0C3BD67_PILCF|nr:hypothetical protein PILCRDRAFT_682449 [Piloderma croceum F 1598]
MGSVAERRGDKGRMSKGLSSWQMQVILASGVGLLLRPHPACRPQSFALHLQFFLEFVPVLLLLITTGMSLRGFGCKSEAAEVGHHLAAGGDLNSPCVGDGLTGRPCITHTFFIF